MTNLTEETDNIQEPYLATEQPICINNAINSLNEIILNELVCTDEKQIIKIIRFKQWLLEQKSI